MRAEWVFYFFFIIFFDFPLDFCELQLNMTHYSSHSHNNNDVNNHHDKKKANRTPFTCLRNIPTKAFGIQISVSKLSWWAGILNFVVWQHATTEQHRQVRKKNWRRKIGNHSRVLPEKLTEAQKVSGILKKNKWTHPYQTIKEQRPAKANKRKLKRWHTQTMPKASKIRREGDMRQRETSE